MPASLVYSGKYQLTDIEPETGLTVGKLVLSPTRTYAPVVKAPRHVDSQVPPGLSQNGANRAGFTSARGSCTLHLGAILWRP